MRRRLHYLARDGKVFSVFTAAAAAVTVALLMMTAGSRMGLLLKKMAAAKVNAAATRALNEAVSDSLSESSPDAYSDIVALDRDGSGNVTALRTDMVKINRIKTDIVGTLNDALEDLDFADISVPVGSLIGGRLLFGRGPGIPVRAMLRGSVETRFISAFSAAGINQTRHQIILETCAHIGIVLPGSSASTDVSTQTVLSETLVIGSVPESYTYIDDNESSLLGRINDYAGGYGE